MTYLLDTNVVSEVRKPGAERRVVEWMSSVPQEQMFLSVVVLGEFRRGIERLQGRDPVQVDALEDWLQGVRASFVNRILDVDEEIADEWGRLSARMTLAAEDALIAATARVKGLTLVTRNVKHLSRTGVPLINPWDDLTASPR